MMAKTHPGHYPTDSGISPDKPNMKHAGFVNPREFYLALKEGLLDYIFACHLGSTSDQKEHLARLLGQKLWEFAIVRAGRRPTTSSEGFITMTDGTVLQPSQHMRLVFPECANPNGYILKLGFYNACFHPFFQKWREEWVETYGLSPQLCDDSSDESDGEDESEDESDGEDQRSFAKRPKGPRGETVEEGVVKKKRAVVHPTSLATPAENKATFDTVVEALRVFQKDVHRRSGDDSLFVDDQVVGPSVEGYLLFGIRRSVQRDSGSVKVDFYMKPPKGAVLRSVPELKRSLA